MMEKIIQIAKKFDFIRNSAWLVPIMFLICYPRRKQYAFDAIRQFLGDDISEKRKRQLARKMVWCKLKYHFRYGEFFLFDAENLSCKGKAAFISDNDAEYWANKMNLMENRPIFENKMLTYKYFGKYYCRDVCKVDKSEEAIVSFKEFAAKNARFIAKPLSAFGGIGVKIFDVKDYSNIEKLYSKLLVEYNNCCIAESLIEQAEEVKKLHPSSVNTVRMTTFNFGDRVEIFNPFMRIGQHGNVVDNATSGGIISNADIDTGILYAAKDEFGKSFIIHPDSGEQIIGYKIPRWEEAKDLAKELARVVPSNRYTGWDLALTNSGWVMVEGNSCAGFGAQYPIRIGFKPKLMEILAEMNIHT